jgi:hypothetical protein
VAVWLTACAAMVGRADTPASYVWKLPRNFPTPRVPADNPMSDAKVDLGRHLFYDTRLSSNGTQSCSGCHQQELAFTEGRGRSVGSTGQVHPRGSMSLVNVRSRSIVRSRFKPVKTDLNIVYVRDTVVRLDCVPEALHAIGPWCVLVCCRSRGGVHSLVCDALIRAGCSG